MLHCINFRAQQPIPHFGVVILQEERLQDVLGPEDGCNGLMYNHISSGFYEVNCIAVLEGTEEEYGMF